MKKVLSVVLATLLMGLSGCRMISPTDVVQQFDWPIGVSSTNQENILMGAGEFAYYDGFIYFAPPGDIIAEVDLSTMKIAVLDIPCGTWIPNMTTDGEYIYFDATGGGEGRYRISADGKVLEKVSGYLDQAGAYRYNDGTDSFYLKGGVNGPLCYENLETHEVTQLFEAGRSFYVDEDYIYAVIWEEGFQTTRLYRSKRDVYDFQEIKLISSESGEVLKPLIVFVRDNTMYICEKGTFRVHTLDLSAVTSLDQSYVAQGLPVQSLTFYLAGDKLVYQESIYDPDLKLDGSTGGIRTHGVYAYDMKTGETDGILDERVYAMCALADRYVCMHTSDGSMCIFDLEKWEYLAFDLGEEEAPEDTAASEST